MDHDREAEPFLPDGKEAKADFQDSHEAKQRRFWTARAALFHILLVLLYSGAFLTALIWTNHPRSASAEGPLIKQRLPTHATRFTLAEETAYAGPPSPDGPNAVDAAWAHILKDINLRVAPEELAPTNQSSVSLPGGGRLAWLEAHHQLHCVKYLRQWTYRDHYHPEVGKADEKHWLLHADHCLHLVAQSIKCRPDTSLMTFEWADGERKPMLKLESPPHQCVDWDEVMGQVESRVVGKREMESLANPDL